MNNPLSANLAAIRVEAEAVKDKLDALMEEVGHLVERSGHSHYEHNQLTEILSRLKDSYEGFDLLLGRYILPFIKAVENGRSGDPPDHRAHDERSDTAGES
jgi:hypothetical protein